MAADLIAQGVQHQWIPDPITRAALRERYPSVVRWPEEHPVASGLLLSVAFVVILAIVLIVMFIVVPT